MSRRIDLQQLHVWTDEFAGAGGATGFPRWEKLKKQGKITATSSGSANNTPEDGLKAVEGGGPGHDTVQVIYKLD